MIPNFSELFVEFCGKLEKSFPAQFHTTRMAKYNDRIAAVYAEFSSTDEKKLMGIMKTGLTSHCHEYRLCFAVPDMNLAELEDWWNYCLNLQKTMIPVDDTHEFSMLSIILVCGSIDKSCIKKLSSKSSELRYKHPLSGWSSVRLAAIDLSTKKIYANSMGKPLRDLIKPLI